MINPDAATMIAFLHRQRNHLHERQTLKKAVRGAGERVMHITQRPRGDSSDEESTLLVHSKQSVQAKTDTALDPGRFATAVRAVWARPSLHKHQGHINYQFLRVCAVCNKFDPSKICEGGPTCKPANNSVHTALGREDMRASRDVTGSGVGADYFCFRCGTKGHFARDCSQQTQAEKTARPADPLVQLALAARDRGNKADSRRSVPQMQKTNKWTTRPSSFVQRNKTEKRAHASLSPLRSSRDRPDFENGKWRDLDLTPKNGSSGKPRDSRR
jgi:hypothetical protein